MKRQASANVYRSRAGPQSYVYILHGVNPDRMSINMLGCHWFAEDIVHPNLYLLTWTAPPQMVNYVSGET